MKKEKVKFWDLKSQVDFQNRFVVEIIQGLFPNSRWAKDLGNKNMKVKLFFIAFIFALVICLVCFILIQCGLLPLGSSASGRPGNI